MRYRTGRRPGGAWLESDNMAYGGIRKPAVLPSAFGAGA
jgi:hypothetical protein